jgi:riboflavin synthase alpha subunit
MKLSKKDYEFFDSMEFGLKMELERAIDWNDPMKTNFIKGQLDMLRTIKNLDEDKKIINFKL